MGSITVTNLGKAYKQYPNRWARLIEWAIPRRKPRHSLHWVLQGINFTINPGEAVGIVGVNGAGKSTLLKMITGTTQPTTGSVSMTGRVAALLELGIGFHPDFTGRQNAYMAGQLLGLGADEIVALMPEIEAFAEIGGYIDQAVRAYSSGMQMRLAFSVATAHRPDVLIVDEALSVGDAYFQHKCTERIRAFQAAGTTLLFVSHSAAAIKSLCNRAIMLAAGSVARDGSPDEVIDHYNALIVQRTNNYHVNIQKGLDGRAVTRSGTGGAIVQSIDIFVNGTSSRVMKSSVPVDIILTAANVQAVESLCAGILIRDRWGYDVWGTNTFHHGIEMDSPTPGELTSFKFHLPNLYLAPGSYSISAALHAGRDHLSTNFDWCDRMLTFEVVQGAGPMCAGLCNLPVDVTATSV
jgi:lipopolysaccharide transport system ATP-binding protein